MRTSNNSTLISTGRTVFNSNQTGLGSSLFKRMLLLMMALFSTAYVAAQSNRKFIDTGSVNSQFDYLVNNAEQYKHYLVIRRQWMEKLAANVTDSLEASRKEIALAKQRIGEYETSLGALKLDLKKADTVRAKLLEEKQQISFLNIGMSKGLFKGLSLTVIGVLIFLLIVFIDRFQRGNSLTKSTLSRLRELENDFDNFRKKAMEREQKVGRRLQDEINRQKNKHLGA
ncbi:MAG: hypothetical protein QGH06_02230 [Lutibacter sp.]|nr:hypothetical protein [Lutibacter sp.]